MMRSLADVTIPTGENIPKDIPDPTRADIPLPSNPNTALLIGLFLLAALTAAYFAAEVILPIVLWGVVAFLFNYVPIMGPLAGVIVFLFAGFLAIPTLWMSLLPAGLYFLVHVVEGETVTPMLLARRFTLNPVLVIVALIFWFWMWGVPGAILSVPMLAITKIICDGIEPLNAVGHFLEGEAEKS